MICFGLVWFCMVWNGFCMVWYGLVWLGLIWLGLVWFGMVWFGLVWFDVLAKTPGLYQGPKLRNLNFIFLGPTDGGTEGGRDRVTYISARSRIKMNAIYRFLFFRELVGNNPMELKTLGLVFH